MPRRPADLVVTRTADSVRVAWDNRGVPMRLLPLVAMVMMPSMCLGFFALGDKPSWAFAALVLVPVALLVGYSLFTRRWREAVELTRDAIWHNRTGFLAPGPRTYPLTSIREVGFGHYPGTGDECEMMRTLNLVHEGVWLLSDRTYVGYWLTDRDLRRVFDELRAFAADAELPVQFVRYDEARPGEPRTNGIPPSAG